MPTQYERRAVFGQRSRGPVLQLRRRGHHGRRPAAGTMWRCRGRAQRTNAASTSTVSACAGLPTASRWDGAVHRECAVPQPHGPCKLDEDHHLGPGADEETAESSDSAGGEPIRAVGGAQRGCRWGHVGARTHSYVPGRGRPWPRRPRDTVPRRMVALQPALCANGATIVGHIAVPGY
jgi:hypothetical protein